MDILLVDDDVVLLDHMAELLRGHGYNVITARDGAQALHILLAAIELPALIIADCNMPHMTGVELMATLRSYLRFEKIPAVLISGVPLMRNDRLYERYLLKPISADSLLELVVDFVVLR